MTSETTPIAALDTLRAIAHPARIRIYELLVLNGPATVSHLAERAKLAVGSASYHLQQLHQAGLVEEAPEASRDRRTHWWRAVPGGLQWSPVDFLNSASGREASASAQRMLTERRIKRLAQWNASWHKWSKEWIEAAMESDGILRLTPQELSQMSAEITEVTRRWTRRSDAALNEGAVAQRSTVFMFVTAFPVDPQEEI